MPISRKRNELSVGVLTAVFLSIQFLLPLKVPGTFLWALLPTLIRINTAVLYSALLLCSTQLSDVKMNTYSNRCDAKPTAAHTGRCLAVLPCCLFLKIRKSKPSFAQVLESHIAGVKVLFWHVQRFLLTESARRRQKKNRARLMMWKGMKYVQEAGGKSESRVFSFSENIAVRRHEREPELKRQRRQNI